MIRNLRILFAGAMLLMTLGALSAPGAQAAQFHCSLEPCRVTLKPDGAVGSKTAHHQFVFLNTVGKGIQVTCNQITGSGITTKTPTEIQFSGIVYDECNNLGVTSVIRTNGCKYLLKSAGTLTIEGCEAGKKIEVEVGEGGCIFEIGEQGPLGGMSFHTEGAVPKRELTAEINIKNIAVTSTSTAAQCGGLHIEGTALTGQYTTGNTLITGEENKAGGTMGETWWE